ncbi:hypothetical protein BN946_scf185042.g177 [Trametes cinnabarina]|uniref:Transcription factor domain-containing protein n=1 Tax=Pycnoporus cinnabarinus TaxID=5643 RepID=A0A060S4M7_PYCCI|nr:hypothetical protein BN946_scf185042.g177 [Trametes cinnabarina]
MEPELDSEGSPRPQGSSRGFNSSRCRIRPKISLDPEQPPTALGKPRARVYVACNQCYEAQPKRRGRDKTPGGRRARKFAKTTETVERNANLTDSDTSSNDKSSSTSSTVRSESVQLWESYENFSELLHEDLISEYDPFAVALDTLLDSSHTDEDIQRFWNEEVQDIPARPSLQFTKETWWDALLSFYASGGNAEPVDALSLTAEQRSATMRSIVTDVRALFQSSLYWVSFINIPRFFNSILDPKLRGSMQPSLLLAALALGTLALSSEAENGAPGRARALKLIDLADSAVQASLASGWVDLGLVQASWLMLYFELQSHPLRCDDRERSALLLLDSLTRLFSLTTLDADLKGPPPSQLSSSASACIGHMHMPASNHASSFNNTMGPPKTATPNTVLNAVLAAARMEYEPPQITPLSEPFVPDNTTLAPSTSPATNACNCSALTISYNWPSVRELAPGWLGTLMWPTGLSEGEFRKEECRRLVWSSVMLTASLNSYISLTGDFEYAKIVIQDPRNYALLFPGESLAMAGRPVQPNNVWTLYLRAMLLLHSCVRVRGDKSLGDGERAQFALKAWLEIEALEGALDQHTCGLERNFGFQAREMLFKSVSTFSHGIGMCGISRKSRRKETCCFIETRPKDGSSIEWLPLNASGGNSWMESTYLR